MPDQLGYRQPIDTLTCGAVTVTTAWTGARILRTDRNQGTVMKLTTLLSAMLGLSLVVFTCDKQPPAYAQQDTGGTHSQPALLAAVAPAVVPPSATVPFDTSPWDGITTDELLGQRCANEATWNTVDCTIIVRIAMNLGGREEDGLRRWLLEHHGNASLRIDRSVPSTNERGEVVPSVSFQRRSRSGRSVTIYDGRPWIGDLRADGHEPRMWTWGRDRRTGRVRMGGNQMSWEHSGLRHWNEILATVRDTRAGRIPYPCDEQAQIWGGPQIDATRIAAMQARGYHIISCPGAENHYMRQ